MAHRPMRNENGFGSISKLSGNRRRPYRATVLAGYKENGTAIRTTLGYFATYNEAYACLLNKKAVDGGYIGMGLTYEEAYRLATEDKQSGKRQLAENSLVAYRSAHRCTASIQKKKMTDLRLRDLQKCIDDCKLSVSVKKIIIVEMHMVFKWAVKNDVIEKDYSRYVEVRDNTAQKHGTPFTQNDLRTLWKYADADETVRSIIIMCYSGFRIAAFKGLKVVWTGESTGYFQGGVKTAQSKDRIVPFHPAAVELIRGWDHNIEPQRFRKEMYETLERYGIEKHTPHDCRHTFSTLCDLGGVSDFDRRMLMGHVLGDVDDSVYRHRSVEQLQEAVNKLPVYLYA